MTTKTLEAWKIMEITSSNLILAGKYGSLSTFTRISPW
jgi:hypothetical protein